MSRQKRAPVVSTVPPGCPFCKNQKYRKQGGAFKTLEHYPKVSKFYRVKCAECDQNYVLREIREYRTASVSNLDSQ